MPNAARSIASRKNHLTWTPPTRRSARADERPPMWKRGAQCKYTSSSRYPTSTSFAIAYCTAARVCLPGCG